MVQCQKRSTATINVAFTFYFFHFPLSNLFPCSLLSHSSKELGIVLEAPPLIPGPSGPAGKRQHWFIFFSKTLFSTRNLIRLKSSAAIFSSKAIQIFPTVTIFPSSKQDKNWWPIVLKLKSIWCFKGNVPK